MKSDFTGNQRQDNASLSERGRDQVWCEVRDALFGDGGSASTVEHGARVWESLSYMMSRGIIWSVSRVQRGDGP